MGEASLIKNKLTCPWRVTDNDQLCEQAGGRYIWASLVVWYTFKNLHCPGLPCKQGVLCSIKFCLCNTGYFSSADCETAALPGLDWGGGGKHLWHAATAGNTHEVIHGLQWPQNSPSVQVGALLFPGIQCQNILEMSKYTFCFWPRLSGISLSSFWYS